MPETGNVPDAAMLPAIRPVETVGEVYRTAFIFESEDGPVYDFPTPQDTEDPRLLRVLGVIASGGGAAAILEACKAEGWNETRFRQWAYQDNPPGLKALYREARRLEMDGFQDQMMVIAKGEHRVDAHGKPSKERDSAGAVYRDQAVTKLMQWRMQRQAPDDFGDRGVVDETGKAVARQVIVVGGQSITF
jgi:hypothetical protein